MATSQKLGWIIRSMPWSSILGSWGELGAQRLHKMGHKAELGGEASWLGTSLWEGRFPLHIKREEVIIWTEPLLYCDHNCPSPKSESISRGKRSLDSHHNIYWLVKGLNVVDWWWKTDNKKVLSTSHCGRPSSMNFVKSFQVSSSSILYLWLDVCFGPTQVLSTAIAVYNCEI